MRGRFASQAVLAVLFMLQIHVCLASESSDPNDTSKYLDAVREFADNVLKYGRDTYGPKHTPLFVDGLNIHTHEPVKWIDPDGTRWILSNLASQQNLFRTLDGLTNITGDPKYKQAAKETIKYAFENLRSPNGLMYWGHGAAYDAMADDVWKTGGEEGMHVLKLHYPFYELMWEVDAKATKEFIEAFWSAHILDWSNLDMDRISYLGERLEEPWNHEYKGGPTFFKSKRSWGIANILTGSSLVQAGTTLYKLSGEERPLIWSKRLAKRFVDTRHPKTGISAFMYNTTWFQLGEDMKEHFVNPYTKIFPWDFYEWRRLYYPENAQAHPWMSIFLAGKLLGEEGKEFTRWALEEFKAWGRISYRKKDNCFVPILTDGTNLEGYIWERGPGCNSGMNVIKPYPADTSFFWSYSVVYSTTGDEFIWQMVRDIALGNNFGDIGQTPEENAKLQTSTVYSNVYALFGFLELYTKTKKSAYLEMARRFGDNILLNQFHKGFFVPSKKHIYTRFDCFEQLALLHLVAAIRSKLCSVPQAWPSCPLFVPPYRHKGQGNDRRDIYTLTEASEPPMSLQEATAIGDVNLVRILIDNGNDVESVDEDFLKTALHCASISGYKNVAELILAEGATVDSRDVDCRTPLHYAAEQGHKEIAELLIAKGADVNARKDNGNTPLHCAVIAGHKDIVELLIAKGADINAKNGAGDTPLHYAARYRGKDIFQLLVSKGADVDVKNEDGQTPKDIVARHTKFLVLIISAVAMPVVVGIVLAIPLVLSLRKVTGQPKRFFRYFALLISVCLVEYSAFFAAIVLSSGPASGLVWELAFASGLACVWGIVFGLWLRGRSTARKVLKVSAFVSLYASLPIVCFGIPRDIIRGVSIANLYNLALLGMVMLKAAIIISVVGLLIRLGRKSSAGKTMSEPMDKTS